MISNVFEGMIVNPLELLKLRITAVLRDDFKLTQEIIEEILVIAESEKDTSMPEVSFFISVFNSRLISENVKDFLLVNAEEGNYGTGIKDYVKKFLMEL